MTLIEEARRLVEDIQAGEHRDRELIIYVMVRLASELEQAQQAFREFPLVPDVAGFTGPRPTWAVWYDKHIAPLRTAESESK